MIVNERSLQEEMEKSKELLKLKDDFDGEGSPHYDEETLKRTWEFLKLYEEKLQENNKKLEVPDIGPGPHGTIDVYWNTNDFTLLINIPVDPSKRIAYSGHEKSSKIKGGIGISEYNSELAHFMRERQTKNL